MNNPTTLYQFPDQDAIHSAALRIEPYIHFTPVLRSAQFDSMSEGHLFFKCENFQKAGAFKSRGAMNAILSLDQKSLLKGVATHSSGNHAQALARAAMIMKTKAYIVMPETAPQVKVDAVKAYGGIITFCKPTLEDREKTLSSLVQQTGAHVIHPYNDYRVITGQATACKEMLSQTPHLDLVLCPVGGGGLLSGTALSLQYFSPATKLVACEPQGADDAYRSFKSGYFQPSIKPDTIADGLLTSLGDLTYPIIKQYVSDIVTVDDMEIIKAMKLIWERMKIVIEPSSAVPLAAVLSGKINVKGLNVGIILSGGNIDLNKIPWL